ncbi:MAG: TadE/TadG family type IV pilus assembly protein [Alphaproteobacteria bacterium]
MVLSAYSSWRRSEDGVTAIEFSLVALPFFMLLFGILEIAILFMSASLLEGAAGSSSRLIRTGQLQQGGGDQAALFREAVCEYAVALIPCDDVVIEVQEMDSFADFAAMAPEYDEDGVLVSSGFDAGGSDSRVMVRVGYQYEMMTPFIGPLIAGSDNALQFLSTIILQNEPYDFSGV